MKYYAIIDFNNIYFIFYFINKCKKKEKYISNKFKN